MFIHVRSERESAPALEGTATPEMRGGGASGARRAPHFFLQPRVVIPPVLETPLLPDPTSEPVSFFLIILVVVVARFGCDAYRSPILPYTYPYFIYNLSLIRGGGG